VPRLSVWFLKAGLIYLLLGFTFGGLLLAHKGIHLSPFLWQLLPAHIEFLLIGWTLQLIMGVAFWILPRFSREPKRGDERLAWMAFVLVNLGVCLSAAGPFTVASVWISLVGRSAEALAAIAFILHAWPRVKPLGA
jgi:heme/copper-type cytochrome/quinol oxidase subunit 1